MTWRILLSGGVAGAVTAVGFAALHELLISDIWFSVVPMMVAAALCGICLSWTYSLLFAAASGATWSKFITLQVILFVLLGVVSVAVFDPVIPMAVLIAANEPPSDLINQAMPLTVGFILVASVAMSLLWGRTLRKFGSSLVTSAVLIVLLGLNVSVLGLVEMSGASAFVLGEFFALLIAILVGFGVAFFLLERRRLFKPQSAP